MYAQGVQERCILYGSEIDIAREHLECSCRRLALVSAAREVGSGGNTNSSGNLRQSPAWLECLPLNPERGSYGQMGQVLASKLGNLISLKGEDILLTTPTTQMVRHHRLRASVPSALWRWRIVSGWRWRLGKEHINSLELRSILTTLRWRLEHKGHFGVRFIHLTDSLVCLHCLTRGRSSSRKLRRTMARIKSLLLATNSQPLWGYVHTDQNPADKPSRWGRRVRTKYRNVA